MILFFAKWLVECQEDMSALEIFRFLGFQIPFAHCGGSLLWRCSDEACTSGQLVIASRESQYKILNFHHGGLDKLAEVFQQWKCCRETQLKDQVPAHGPKMAD